MNQETINYIKGRITSQNYEATGDITTECQITFDNNFTAKGCSVRSVDNYETTEANNAALEDAVKGLYEGVDFILKKTTV